ncbi:MAG: prolyl oligopeptidase family serine peptidase, partial [Chloroflexota bacterium]
VSPQCPITSWWAFETEALKALLDSILAEYAVDADRVYLTGLSMGGYGSWALGIQHPELFAAVVPICGGGEPDAVCVLKNVPVWAFHGDADPVVELSESVKMVEALQACGGDVKLTVYPGVEHDSWTQTYANPELYEWFLSHKRHV